MVDLEPVRRLQQWQGLVNRALEEILPHPRRHPRVIHEAMRYCVFPGGKRFRPLLCLGGCSAVGGPLPKAVPVACALELLHTYSLVHDDLPAMDNADVRRGLPSCHRKYGEATAILVGDALLTLAFELLSRNGTPKTLSIIRTIGHASGTTGLIGGQVLDLALGCRKRGGGLQQLEEVARRKTTSLIAASVVAGALAGGGSASQRRCLERFGQRLGLAFQLIDDLHDREGLAEAMGLEEAKRKARRLIARGLDELKPFGVRAEALRALADWLSSTA